MSSEVGKEQQSHVKKERSRQAKVNQTERANTPDRDETSLVYHTVRVKSECSPRALRSTY